MRAVRCSWVILGLAVLGSSAPAQTRRVLLEEGGPVLGMGSILQIDHLRTLRITDRRFCTSLVTTNGGTGESDCVDQRTAYVTLREGMLLGQPAGTTIVEFRALELNRQGNLVQSIRLRLPPPNQSTVRNALAWNLNVIAQQQNFITATNAPGQSKYESFDFVELNDRNVLIASGDILAPSRKDAILSWQLDDLGNVVSHTIFAMDDMAIDAMGGALVRSFGTSEGNYDINERGDVLCFVGTSLGNAVLLNLTTPVAREFTPTSIPFRDWSVLGTGRCAINDLGDYVVSGTTTGATTAYLIEKNGQKFVMQGDVLPAFSPNPIGAGSNAPIVIANTGDVFWRAVELGSATNEAFMRNHEPIVRVGDRTLEGDVITDLELSDASFAVSPNGRFFVGAVDLADQDALVFVDLGLVLPLSGCLGNPGKLELASGAARVGQNMVFSMDDGHVTGALCRINFSTRRSLPSSECGLNTPFGEWMISGSHRVGSLFPPPWNGVDPTLVGTTVPPDPVLVDAVFFAQGIFRKAGTANITFTNALRIEIGAP